MKTTRTFTGWAVFAAAALLLSAAGVSGAASSSRGRDAWLADVLRNKLAKTLTNGGYEELGRQTEQAILARLRCGQLDRTEGLTEMVFVLRGTRYLPLAERTTGKTGSKSGKELAKWLLEHKDVSRLLFRALADVRNEGKAMARLAELIGAEEKKVLTCPQLAVAFATSVPYSRTPRKQRATTLSSFRYYTAKVRFKYNVRTMPYEISRHLADTRLSIAERQWALSNYGRHSNPARAFFDVKYDYDYYRKGVPKKISGLPYLLPNLYKVGGVCDDQAYYAAEICKALGIPAAWVCGKGATGGGHAWTACLRNTGRRATWDSSTGRYKQHLYYIGRLRDPATGRFIKECEFMLALLAIQLPLEQREQADALTVLAHLVDRAVGDKQQVDVAIINKLAEVHDAAPVKRSRPKADIRWVKAARAMDISLVEDLLAAVFKKNLVHTRAWELVVAMCKSGKFSTKQMVRFMDVLVRRTAVAYPDYSYDLIMRIAPTIKDHAERRKLYNRLLAVYRHRPDLGGRVLIAVGDDYRDQDDMKNAIKSYDRAAALCSNLADIVVPAAKRAEDIYIKAGKTNSAIKMYATLMNRAVKVDAVSRSQTAHYQLGMRLVALLEQGGKSDSARRVRILIGAK